MSESTAAPELREMFNASLYRQIATELSQLAPNFDHRRFLQIVTEGHGERALMARMRQTAVAVHSTLPGTYVKQLQVLRALAPKLPDGFITLFLSEFVSLYGAENFDVSLAALAFFTRFGSAEFAIRTFLQREPERVIKIMTGWAEDPNEHVRRLASEGCRPRLPWGLRLKSLVHDPAPIRPILEQLKNDPSLYVRKSVANNLNDIAKDHPGWVLTVLESWDLSRPHSAWIARHASRTLIKRGDLRALKLFGVKAARGIKAEMKITPSKIKLGDALLIDAMLQSKARHAQRLLIDYVVHYVKASGRASAKIFKWTEIELAANGAVHLKKRQVIRDFTTRRHHAGHHRVELQINGTRLAESSFFLAK